jgi:hypothetical protein
VPFGQRLEKVFRFLCHTNGKQNLWKALISTKRKINDERGDWNILAWWQPKHDKTVYTCGCQRSTCGIFIPYQKPGKVFIYFALERVAKI